MGPGALRGGGTAGRAGLRLDRLLDLPLVSRHGARELQRPEHRAAAQRGLRGRQGRPRGASGGRCRLPHRGERLHAEPRLAAQRLRDTTGAGVLRGHLLAPGCHDRASLVPAGPRGGRGRLGEPASRGRDERGGGRRRDPRARRAPGWSASRPRRARHGGRPARRARGRRVRRVRDRAQVPGRAGPRIPARARQCRGGRSRRSHADRDGGIRAPRSGRGRLLPLRDPSRLDRAALRAHALRQRAAARRLRSARDARPRAGGTRE